jgi:hypothetical protein
MIRAKMKVDAVTQTGDSSGVTQETVTLSAVHPAQPKEGETEKEDPNKLWSKWTPSANVSISVTNPECFGKFIPGKEYFVDFSLSTE